MIRLIAIAAAAAGLVVLATADDDRMQVEFDAPGTVCLPFDRDVQDRLARDELRLALGITRYDPAERGASIRARLIESPDGSGVEIARVGLYPGDPFETTGEDEPRRFALALPEDHAGLAEEYALCIAVDLVTFAGEPVEGALAGFVELVGEGD